MAKVAAEPAPDDYVRLATLLKKDKKEQKLPHKRKGLEGKVKCGPSQRR